MRAAFLGSLVIAPLLLVGCDWEDLGPSTRYKEDFHHSYDLKPGARLSLESFNGAIEIYGWDKDTAEISGTKYAATEELLAAIKFDIDAAPDSLRIRAIRPFERRGNMGVKFVVRAPRRLELDRIVSSNGSIRAENIEGNARLRTSNGSLRFWNVKGDIEASTSNGSVELKECQGGAVLHSSNGSIKADAVRGHLEAVTSNASIEARLLEPERLRPLRLQTSNGNVRLTLEAVRENDVHATTSNGSITLWLPASAAARVKASTSNSSISTDFDVQTRGAIGKSRLEGTIAGGGPLLDLTTSNGSIKLLKL